MRSPTELTMEASVMKGVQNALQRARLRSSLASSELLLGNGLSTMFRWCGNAFYCFLDDSLSCLSFYIMSVRRSPIGKFRNIYYLSSQRNSITRSDYAR